MKYKNEVGNRYNSLEVIEYFETRHKKAFWLCVCDCGRFKIVRGSYLRSSFTKSCGCLNHEWNNSVLDAFSKYASIIDTKECIFWKGFIGNRGYGQFSYYNRKKMAHRTSYEIYMGTIPANLYVCHTCDNKSCVNPKHLYAGTAAENNFDMRLAKILKNYPKTQN